MSDDLVAWLRGVLDEDERQLAGTPGNVLRLRGSTRSIAAWMLADIEAKRAILGEHPPVDGLAWDATGNDTFPAEVCGTCCGVDYTDTEQPIGDAYPCRTVRLLVSAYRDRAGYRDEWRP